jgi:hypothetical protein
MPKVRRQNLPPALLQHLLDRIQQRQISADQLGFLAVWLDSQPEVPRGKWFKRFLGMTVCGEGELVKAFLAQGQLPEGEEVTQSKDEAAGSHRGVRMFCSVLKIEPKLCKSEQICAYPPKLQLRQGRKYFVS